MKTIILLGEVDKRIITYPLARALSIENNVMLLADDGAYRRLYKGEGDTGTCGRVDIAVGNLYRDDMESELKDFGVDYDYRLVVSTYKIPSGSDFVIYCMGLDKTICPQEARQVIDQTPYVEVTISYDIPEDKSKYGIAVDGACTKYLFDTEERKQLEILPVKAVNKAIAGALNNALGYNKDYLYKLLTKNSKSWKSSK